MMSYLRARGVKGYVALNVLVRPAGLDLNATTDGKGAGLEAVCQAAMSGAGLEAVCQAATLAERNQRQLLELDRTHRPVASKRAR